MTTHRITRRQLVAAGLLAAATQPFAALASDAWPAKPVRFIVPFPPGGPVDTTARAASLKLSEIWKTPTVIDNRAGAGGVVGAQAAAREAPDGYTLFMGAVHHAIAPSMYPKLDYDIEKDFIPLALLANVPQVVVVNPKTPSANFKQFLDYVKRNPAKLNYGSAGAGTSHHLAGELFKQQTGTFITHIPYRGAGPALQDLIGGNVDMMFDGLGSSASHIKSGRIKALMVSGPKRNPAFPDVPCASEVGLPDYTVTTWYGLWAPKGTPADVQARIVDEIKRLGTAEELKAVWASNGADYGGMTQQQFGAFVSSEVKRWAAVVKASGAKLD